MVNEFAKERAESGDFFLKISPITKTRAGVHEECLYINSHKDCTLFHSIEYAEIVATSMRIKAFMFSLIDTSDSIKAALIMYRIPVLPFGFKYTDLAYAGSYGGILADDQECFLSFVRALRNTKELKDGSICELKLLHKDVIDGLLFDGESSVSPVFGNYKLHLNSDPETIWKSKVNQKARNQVRKALKSNLEVVVNTPNSLNDFYYVYRENMKSLGSPALPLHFFYRLYIVNKDSVVLSIVRFNGKPISALFSLIKSDTLHNAWAGALFEFRSLCPNYLNYWSTIEWAARENLTYFDFGRSLIGSPQEHFKMQWGAESEALFYFDVKTRAHTPVMNPGNSLFVKLANIWRALPRLITKYLDTFFAKYTG